MMRKQSSLCCLPPWLLAEAATVSNMPSSLLWTVEGEVIIIIDAVQGCGAVKYHYQLDHSSEWIASHP
ncbi:hypothetical protein PDE_04463 [Penicillium oxalicum 114-2]|uniref:Secreted protein n=1 Tax=Penicillium oxalicum (strain 114-2 / CGMCC 5302) TaxID=933388 RepID=S8ATP8_PENO1|nr:hypothetical protein PDE_04463 [Penicillium oxalicum 114-2]